MKNLIFVLLSIAILSGCSNRAQLPPDVSGDLESINKTQAIDYEK